MFTGFLLFSITWVGTSFNLAKVKSIACIFWFNVRAWSPALYYQHYNVNYMEQMIWPLASILKQVYTLKIAFWGIDLHQENYGWWWYASFTPFLDMKLGKTKILVLWNALNDEKSHNNSQQCLLYYKTWCGGVYVVEILLEVVKKIGFEAFFLLQNVQIFMNLFMISVAKKFRKMGFRVNHLITRILFLQVISHYQNMQGLAYRMSLIFMISRIIFWQVDFS